MFNVLRRNRANSNVSSKKKQQQQQQCNGNGNGNGAITSDVRKGNTTYMDGSMSHDMRLISLLEQSDISGDDYNDENISFDDAMKKIDWNKLSTEGKIHDLEKCTTVELRVLLEDLTNTESALMKDIVHRYERIRSEVLSNLSSILNEPTNYHEFTLCEKFFEYTEV